MFIFSPLLLFSILPFLPVCNDSLFSVFTRSAFIFANSPENLDKFIRFCGMIILAIFLEVKAWQRLRSRGFQKHLAA